MVAYVSGTTGDTSTGSTTSKAATAFSVTSGNTLYVGVRWEGGDTTVTISDTASNSFTQVNTNIQMGATSGYAALFKCIGATGNASDVVTATFGAARTFTRVQVLQFSATGTLTEIDNDTNTTASANTLSTPSMTASGTDGVVIAILGTFSSGSSPAGVSDISTVIHSQAFAFMGYGLYTSGSTKIAGISYTNTTGASIIGAVYEDVTGGGATPKNRTFHGPFGSPVLTGPF